MNRSCKQALHFGPVQTQTKEDFLIEAPRWCNLQSIRAEGDSAEGLELGEEGSRTVRPRWPEDPQNELVPSLAERLDKRQTILRVLLPSISLNALNLHAM